MAHRILLVAVASLLLGTTALGRTWHVRVDGSGDAPTIEAAADSSVAGDTLLVAPGDYPLADAIILPAGTVLISEAGATATAIGGSMTNTFGVIMGTGSAMDGFTVFAFGNVGVVANSGAQVRNCIFMPSGVSLSVDGVSVTLSHNLFLPFSHMSGTGGGVAEYNIILGENDCSGSLIFICNDVVGSTNPCVPPSANFSLDPLFCDAAAGNYFLRPDSPCLPGNGPFAACTEQIGPLPVGCAPVPVETRSWGEVKALYGN